MSDFLSDEYFEKFRSVIYNESGIHFSDSNRSILESRLKERLKTSSLDTLSAYYDLILSDREEMKVLLDSVTTNLTRFFRNTAHIQTFEYYVIPELINFKEDKADKKIRVWSAGCSTGEEPYTLAMVLKEVLPPAYSFEIIGSDISLKSLLIGKEGFYSDSRMSGISDKYLNKYFQKKGNGYQVTDEVKNTVRFDYHNLKNDSGLRNLDIVFCRNVLIYFDEAAQKAAVGRFYDAMSSHSLLFIGHSESLFGMNTRFEFVKTEWGTLYKKFLD